MNRFVCTTLALSFVCAASPAIANLDQPQFPFPFIFAPLLAPLAAAPQYHQPPQYPVSSHIEYEDDTASSQQPAAPSRQIVNYNGGQAAGTIVINTAQRKLFYVLGSGRAVQYAVGVGREGSQWAGTQKITNKQEWPDWYPPKEMLQRKPELIPQLSRLQSGLGVPGGPLNPLGARAMYLWQGNKDTLYRIHGTNEPWTIGTSISSGCIRMINQDVIDLYARSVTGANVIVLTPSPVARVT